MGNNVRVIYNHLGFTYALVVSGEDAAYPAANLESGNLRLFWQGDGAVEHTLMYDSGSGNTVSVDTVVLPFASLLVAAGANVALQRSDDAVAWTDVWTKVPLATADLAEPDNYHYIRESTLDTRRAWRIRIYGTLTAAPALGGSFFMGVRTELPSQPTPGRQIGQARPYKGRSIGFGFPMLSPVNAETIAAIVAAVTPNADEPPTETISGVSYGGVPHWLYDPIGTVLCRETVLVPYLFPVLCLTVDGSITVGLTPSLEQPSSIEWRERR